MFTFSSSKVSFKSGWVHWMQCGAAFDGCSACWWRCWHRERSTPFIYQSFPFLDQFARYICLHTRCTILVKEKITNWINLNCSGTFGCWQFCWGTIGKLVQTGICFHIWVGHWESVVGIQLLLIFRFESGLVWKQGAGISFKENLKSDFGVKCDHCWKM